MTAYDDFLSDPLRRDVFLVELHPWDPVTQQTVTLRYASDEYVTLPSETPANTVYTPAAIEGVNRESIAVVARTTGLLPETAGGEVRIGNLYGDLDTWAALRWDGRRCVIRHTGFSTRFGRLAHADARVLYDGEIAGALPGLDEGTVYLPQPEARFDDDLTTKVFRGTRWCLYFDGSTHYVTYASATKLELTAALTVEAWVYFDSTGADAVLLGWEGTGRPFRLRRTAAGKLELADSGTFSLLSTMTAPTKSWLHVTWIVESATAARLLVYDDTTGRETVETFTGTGFLSRAAASSADFRLGAASDTLDGLLDDVRIWSVARTVEQIHAARHRPLSDDEQTLTELALYAPLDDGTGSAVSDESPSPLSGTLTGTPTWYWAMEGDVDLAGAKKPSAWGLVENIPLIDVDTPTHTHFAIDSPAEAILEVYEGGWTNYTVGNAYTDLVTFLAATTATGLYDTLTYPGGTYVRFKARPSLPATVDLKADASGSGYIETAGEIARRIATTRGSQPLADPGDLDTDSFDDLDTANSETVGYYSGDEGTVRDALDFVLGSVGALGFFRRSDGKFRVEQFSGIGPTALLELDERDIVSVEPILVELPLWRAEVLYQRNWRPLERREQSGALDDDPERRRFVAEEYRRAEHRDESIRTAHPRAEETEWPTGLATRAAAQAEAVRRFALFSGEPSGYQIRASLRGAELDRLQVVTLRVRDLSRYGIEQNRLDWATGKDFVVLGAADVTAPGVCDLQLWG